MSEALDLFRSVRRLSLPLAGGRAPGVWQRQLSCSAERLNTLRHEGAWIETLTTIHPRLCDDPLFGNCLTDLTNDVTGTAQSEPEIAPLTRPTSIAPRGTPAIKRQRSSDANKLAQRPHAGHDHRSGHSNLQESQLAKVDSDAKEGAGRNDDQGPHAGLPKGRTTPPSPNTELPDQPRRRRAEPNAADLPLQASRVLLDRLRREPEPDLSAESSYRGPRPPPGARQHQSAKRTADTARSNPRKSEQPLRAQNFLKRRHEQFGTVPKPRNNELLGSAPGTTDRSAWQGALAKRVGQAIRLVEASPNRQAQPVEALLTHTWSAPIAGPKAPQDLLNRLRRLAPQRKLAAQSSGHDHGASHMARSTFPRQGVAQAGTLMPGHPPSGTLINEDREQASPDRASASASLRSNRGETWSTPEDHHDHRTVAQPSTASGQEARIPPQSVTSPLPPLIPPWVVGMHTEHIAAAIVAQGARDEAAAVGSDLDVLAAKIKRILDEEARRHGIDV